MATTAPPAVAAAASEGSSFLGNLWSSVFTPGPTPTLLIATNATFATLQLLLFALLLATYSIHFLVLSFLSGGLWWSINWFAQELLAVKRTEAEAEALRRRKQSKSGGGEKVAEQGEASTDGARTDARSTGVQTHTLAAAGDSMAENAQQPKAVSRLQQPKRLEAMDQSGDFSTDSEWEAVDHEQS